MKNQVMRKREDERGSQLNRYVDRQVEGQTDKV